MFFFYKEPFFLPFRLSQPTAISNNDTMKMGSAGYPKQNGAAGPNATFMVDSVGGGGSSSSGGHTKPLLPDSIDSQTNGKLAGAEDVS